MCLYFVLFQDTDPRKNALKQVDLYWKEVETILQQWNEKKTKLFRLGNRQNDFA